MSIRLYVVRSDEQEAIDAEVEEEETEGSTAIPTRTSPGIWMSSV